MRRFSFSQCLVFGLLLGGVSSTPVLAQSAIHAGSPTGSYTNDFCPQVERAIRKEFFEHKCATSQGSADNVAKVLENPKDIGIGQFDVVAAVADEQPGRIALVNPGIGLECLYAVTRESGIDNLRGLSPRMPVALPSERSGSTATFRYLQSMDESLANMRNITYFDGAMEAVQAVIDGNAALAFFVQFPNTQNPVFKAINDAGLNFVPVVNRQILRREVAGQQIYQPQEVVVTPAGLLGRLAGREPDKVITTCMPVVLFTGDPSVFPQGSDEAQDQADLIKHLAATKAPDSGNWTDVLKNAVSVSRERMQEMMDRF